MFPVDFELAVEVILTNCMFTALDLSTMDEGFMYFGSTLEEVMDSA